MIDYIWTIKHLRPGSSFSFNGDDNSYESVSAWHDDINQKPTKQECEDAWNSGLSTEYQNEINRERRRSEYPPVGDQLDALYKAFKHLGLEVPQETKDWMDKLTKNKNRLPCIGQLTCYRLE